MSYFGNAIEYKDSPNLDAFSRLRVSIATSLFESQQEYGLSTLIWETATSGGGSSIANNSTTKLTALVCGTGATDYAVLQSRQYVRYIPGKSHLVLLTGIFSPGTVANNTCRAGYFDAANGVFLSVTNGVASITQRTSTSGSVSDSNTATQPNWNIDPFDGTGPSGLTLDLSKTQILFISAQWLGVGRVVVGFDIDGRLWPAHQFLNANNLTVPYTQTFNLPVRLETRNLAGATSTTIQFVCCSVQSEGGLSDLGLPFSVSNGISSIGVTTRRAILSIRPKATFNSLTNRGHINLADLSVTAQTNSCFYELIYNATLGGVPSWTSANAASITEYDVAGTTITGGTVIASGFSIAGAGVTRGVQSTELNSRNPLTISQVDGGAATQNTLTIAATSFTGTSNVAAAINWFERYI